MNQFIQRVANYLANEVFIKGLAESRTFQKFAVRTDKHIQTFRKEGLEHVNSQIDELHKQATRAAYSTASDSVARGGGGVAGNAGGGTTLRPPRKPTEGLPGFFSALGRVIRRDLGLDKK
mmetsp:Transcript_30967/g.65927  ORF Transcript_30967/g.65927 Transcript_30967/m.65927 type:complete len:120 (+) Transcript_30967:143-502(+)|eukprot:CAMPEP_0172531420 /NCGR_PEP_ID=MMETSP1067-20121228/4841_1 /TAXON_ID=265564 ORGANISM="Thalassiosira punctigera, Strain Tpunct2005C2" /NCGR_SAMPLE_ID=MMETSP1067 /ASSEMBLY_ACC=CAM_ASM_000444 /LENGTH=119 /DNA_ID=CAMNT_0013315799 /DNA_START=121 /DNA_END=480 /DNA_ORIENTATION=+